MPRSDTASDRAAKVDAATLRRAQAGDPAALRQVIDRHAPAVFGVLSRMLGRGDHAASVDDLAQETMLRVCTALPRFDPAGAASLSTWILTIATRLALQHRAKRRVHVVEIEPGALASPAATPEAHLHAGTLRSRARAIVDDLSEELRAAFVLAEAHGFTPREIAVALDVPAATVRTRLHRARTRIRTALEGAEQP